MANIRAVRILVVDDDVEAAELLQELLETRGYQVERECRMEQVSKHSECAPFDVVVSDIRLGAWSGLELPALFRAAGESRPLLIALSGDYGDRAEERSLAAGFDAHFSKPLELEQLDSLIRSGRSPQLDETGPVSGPLRANLQELDRNSDVA